MFELPPRIPGLNLTVGGFVPRLRLPSLAGPLLAPVDFVEEGRLAVCVYNPAAVNPFPLPPAGVDLIARYQLLQERNVTLFVISGLPLPLLANWMDYVGLDLYALSDEERLFATEAGIPIKRVEGHNFRTHAALILQEDRILSLLLEADLVHHFEHILMALDVATGRPAGAYELPDQPWYVRRHGGAPGENRRTDTDEFDDAEGDILDDAEDAED